MDVNIDTIIRSTSDDTRNARVWKFFFDKISAIWRHGAGDYISVGQYLIEAKAELQPDAYSAMLKKLRFDPSMVKKLICIAKTTTLSSHVNSLPPCYSTLYCLSQLPKDVLETAIADGSVHPGMMRKDASALRPAKEAATKSTTAKTSSSTNPTELSEAWQTATPEQRRALLDQLGRDGLCATMSGALMVDLRDHLLNINIAGASISSKFAVYATDKFHVALRCAEQPEPDEECRRHMAAALRLILKQANAKGISRSDVVIADGKPRKSRK